MTSYNKDVKNYSVVTGKVSKREHTGHPPTLPLLKAVLLATTPSTEFLMPAVPLADRIWPDNERAETLPTDAPPSRAVGHRFQRWGDCILYVCLPPKSQVGP